ncbi:unnamed protein product [Rotaria sordida]|uniref:LRRNT domain-containing protein n=1 Tax=Rotaria sordida TaxID=392033 RepID=A0A818GQK3_9BILA|nr:unnamed protein product [Rotaria sordida]CAF3493544.1 unnamed protein product [Rotaria sordida]
MSILRPIYPCYYKDLNQRIYKCDMCQCILSPPLFSTSNLCSSLSKSSSLICSDNLTKIHNEELLRLRLDEVESETDHQLQTHYSIIRKQSFNDIQFEFDNFNNDVFKNLFDFEQICSYINNSRLTFYRLQSNKLFNELNTCQLTILSLRFLDTVIENNFLLQTTNPIGLTFYNCTFNIEQLSLTTITTTLSFYYIKFHLKPFLINSLTSLIHLTITYTTNFDIIGSYPNLIYLDLCHTQLNDIQLNKLFSQIDMPDLTTLILSNNNIKALKTKFPSRIRYLDLSNNYIKSLDYTSFKSLYSLNILNLSYNSPLDIQQDTFTRIPYLEILDLTSSLPSLPIDDLFLPLQKLRYLNLSSNNLNYFPRLPIPHDAHTIASYDHHLPVLNIDLSNNNLNKIDFDILSSASTQDKYIISIDMTNNQLKTLQLPSSLSTGIKRRGPLIELNINNNPLECNCILYENIFQLLQTDISTQQDNSFILNPPFQPLPSQQYPSGFYPNQYLPTNILPQPLPPAPPPFYPQSTNLINYIRTRRQLNLPNHPSAMSLLAENLAKQARVKLLHLSNLTCQDIIEPKISRSLFDLNSSNSFCSYTIYCPSTCSCCSSSSPSLYNNNNNNCDCYYQCPLECSCKHSFDLTKNYVNCSNLYLNKIPLNIPSTTTHLHLNNNQIKILEKNLTHLTKLQYLTLANNQLEYLLNDDFLTLAKIEDLDLSSNQIQNIGSRTFSTLFNLRHLYLHNNPWIPKFYSGHGEFQSNIRLNSLTYGNGLSCNRSIISSFTIETPLTADDCCKNSNIESCQQLIHINEHNYESDQEHLSFHTDQNLFTSKRIFKVLFHENYRLYVIIGLSLFILLIIICIIILCCICRRKKHQKHSSSAESKLLTNGDVNKTINHYHKSLQQTSSTPAQISLSSSTTAIQKLINSTRQKSLNSNTAYRQQENDGSISYSDNDDEDDYASIPLTVSQTDLSPVIRSQPPVPPLPPPRQMQQQHQQQRIVSNRPISHSSTVSTSTTIRSIVPMIKRSNSSASKQAQSSLTAARSCLQIKLDALVLYSINDSELVHGDIGEILENMYGKRFSFYFIHRDRMLGELDWLIENSCVTIIILRKPYHIVHDYMKILSTCSSIKIFLILVNDENNKYVSSSSSSSSSLKAREKIAKLYRTSNVYEWNSDPTAIIHEQLELFLEQNCGSATYVPD